MRAILVAALLLVASAAAADDKNVLILDDNNFEAETEKHDALLVEFYAPWCGHCKALEPKWNAAADELASNDETSHLKIAKMDADAQKKVPGRYGVSGFPTIKLFRNGEYAEDYDGGRETADIVAYVKKKASQSINKEITMTTTLKAVTKDPKVPTIIGVFSSHDNVDYKIFKSVVSKYVATGIEVYHTTTSSVLESMNFFKKGGAVFMYRPGQKKIQFKGTLFKDKLNDWIMENVMTKLGAYTPDNEKLYQKTGDHVVRLVTAGDKPTDAQRKVFEAAASSDKYKGIRFATSSLEDAKADVDAQCGKGATVCVLAQEGSKSKRAGVFGLKGDVTESALAAFLDDFVGKKLKPAVKSEAAPGAPYKAGEVAVVVGSNFEEAVIESDKDAFIMFHAPWCGHCKALSPKFDQLAKELAGEFDGLLIGKFDLTANDVPKTVSGNFKVEGFPTVYLAQKGKKGSPIQFDGSREVDAMKKWLEEKRK